MRESALASLHNFRPLAVGRPLPQVDLAAWLQSALARARAGRLSARDQRAMALYGRIGRARAIESRASVLPDYAFGDGRTMILFRARPGTPWHRPTLQARMAIYKRKALRLANAAFPNGERAPDYMVQVSCTGYASPHAVQSIVSRRGWNSKVLHIGHMGCYAAVPVAALAAQLVRGEAATGRVRARASLFFVEMCSLHLKPDAVDDEQVVVNSLFADGAIRFDVSRTASAPALALLDSAEEILPGTEREMTWGLQDSSFEMTLSRAVPDRVAGAVADFTTRFLRGRGRRLSDVAHFAIHPGGPRVIDRILEALNLPSDAARHSRELLRRRGNMSSATLPHIWDAMLRDSDVRDGDLILSLAFGPGLTLTANLLRKSR